MTHPSFGSLVCRGCGSPQLYRRPRSLFDRLRVRAIYKCKDCAAYTGVHYWATWHWCSLTAQCPKCGNPDLKHLTRRDKIDPVTRLLISRIQGLFGAPILYCHYCRLQFYDFRPRERAERKATTD